MRIIEDAKLDFSDVLIVPKRSELVSRKDVILERNYTFLNSGHTYLGVPIIASNMDQTGTFEMAEALSKYNVLVALHKHYSVEELEHYYANIDQGNTFYTMGISETDFKKFETVYKRVGDNIDMVSIDVANGYSEPFVGFVERVRSKYPELTIMAGAVVTGEITEQLLLSGADIVRVGIGSGSVCITRKVAGVGYPQLSAVIECADAAHGHKGHIVSDGGCTMPGDVAKAFGAGADFVMLGGMFAGHDECNGEPVYQGDPFYEANPDKHSFYSTPEAAEKYGEDHYYNVNNGLFYRRVHEGWEPFDPFFGKTPTHMKFYGMSSSSAMEKYAGGVAEYRASEGKEVLVPYRGPIENTIKEILGGVRSACTYTGSKTLKELSKRTTFIKVHRTHNTVFGDQ